MTASNEMQKAHCAVRQATLKGQLPAIRTRQCVCCGRPAEHYHHHSYAPEKRLDVTPVCSWCHRYIHGFRENFASQYQKFYQRRQLREVA